MTPQELRRRRFSIGLSYFELATYLGVSSRTLRSWEEGAVAPDDPTLDPALRQIERARLDPRRLNGRPARLPGARR